MTVRSLSLRRLLPPLVATRLLTDTANQLFNPFLSTIAIGLGISVPQLGMLLSLRSLSGLSGPVLGGLADRRGYLSVARLGVVLMAAGLALLAVSDSLLVAALAMLPMGVALGIINPALQAYVSSAVHYSRRARGLGAFEYSWALAGIIGLSLLGWLISAAGWRVAVLTLAGLILLSLFGLVRLPAAAAAPAAQASPIADPYVLRAVRAGAAATGLIFFAMLNVMLMHGVWLSEAFLLTPANLGTVAFILGCADLAGAVVVTGAADRLTARRVALIATALCSLSYLLLPMLAGSLTTAVVSLVLMRLLMQTSFISLLTILSEQLPLQRALVMAWTAAIGQIGMAIAGLSGPWLYLRTGLLGLGIASAVAMAAALALILVFVSERRDIHDPQ